MIVMLCVLMLSAGTLLAQPGGGGQGGPGGQGGRGGRGGLDPAARLEQMKAALGASDEEWSVLLPKIQKVETAQQEAQTGGRGGRGGGRGGRGGGGGGAPAGNNAVAQALADLQQTLQNTNAPAEQISQKLQVLRDARARARANLDTARKELKDLLTARQEAVLVANYGLLE
jgi:hypothetical protein